MDLQPDGIAVCRSCGRASAPRTVWRFAEVSRVAIVLSLILLTILGVEALVSLLYAGSEPSGFVRTFATLAFFTGVAAVAAAGLAATVGRRRLAPLPIDRFGRMAGAWASPPALSGVLRYAPWSKDIPDTAGVLILAGLGVLIMALAYVPAAG